MKARLSSWISSGILLLLIVPVWAQNSPSFTPEQVKAFHQEPFNPRPFTEWNHRGDFTRFVYLNAAEFWAHTPLTRKDPVLPLTYAERQEVADFKVVVGGARTSLKDYVRGSPTDAIIVVHKGRIVFEDYSRMQPQEKHIWYSVSKTLVSTAVAILEDRGKIDANKTIDSYLPDLKGSAWGGIRVIDILDMASGMDCSEKLGDTNSTFWAFYDAFGWPAVDKVGNPREVLKTMRAQRPAGKVKDYTSVNTEVLGWLVEAVSGERYAKFIEREIWQRLGAEHDALILTTPSGNSFSAGGVCSTLRDLARFGVLFTPSGRSGGDPVVSSAYLQKIQKGGRPNLIKGVGWYLKLSTLASGVTVSHSTYQWDAVTSSGDFFKGGYGGQGLYVSPGRDLVVAWFGTPTKDGNQTWMFNVALQLANGELFTR